MGIEAIVSIRIGKKKSSVEVFIVKMFDSVNEKLLLSNLNGLVDVGLYVVLRTWFSRYIGKRKNLACIDGVNYNILNTLYGEPQYFDLNYFVLLIINDVSKDYDNIYSIINCFCR